MHTILNYEKAADVQKQDTGYNCGPASVQLALMEEGIRNEEAIYARFMGTTTNGTNHIGLVTNCLNKYTNGAYVTTFTQNDPLTPKQKDQFWADLVKSIHVNGRAVVINIDAPVGNYPRAVPPSTVSPRYGGGEVLHYFTAFGVSDQGMRKVLIVDSGFTPHVYWISFDQLATLVTPKGYSAGILGGPTGGAGEEDMDSASWKYIMQQLMGSIE